MPERHVKSIRNTNVPGADTRLLWAGLVALAGTAAPALGGRLLAVDSSRVFYEIDMLTGGKTVLGTVSANAGTTGGLAYNRLSRTMYVTSTSLDSVFTLNLNTFNATLIGAYGDAAIVMHGLEFDESTTTLYGASSHNGGLYQINQAGGIAGLVGLTGLSGFVNLGYNSSTNLLYATSSGTDSFHLIDRTNGAATPIGLLNGPTSPNALAFNFQTNQMFLVDNTTDNLYTIDLATGQATLVGSTGSGNLLGLVFVPGRELTWNPAGPGGNLWTTNPAAMNWLEGPASTSFMNGDIANFTESGLGVVNVDAPGVLPESTNISNVSGTYIFTGGPIGGSGGITKTGTGEAILQNNNNTFTGGVFVNGGVLGVSQDANLGAPGGAINFDGGTLRTIGSLLVSDRDVTVNAGGGAVEIAAMTSATLNGPITGPGTLSKTGAGQLVVRNVRSAGLNIGVGEIKVLESPVAADPAGTTIVNTLQIAGGPTAPTARIDLSNNAMIVGDTPTDGGPDAESAILGYISSGYAGGSWGGQGITSTSADFGVGNFALGYGDAGPLGYVSFLGFPVLSTDTLIRYTLYGDANLDGTVNLNDFNLLAANFGLSSGGLWRLGDFDYDGRVNLNDFNRLAANFGLSAGPDGVVGPDDWSALASVVPEPGAIGLLAVSAVLGLRRRRRV